MTHYGRPRWWFFVSSLIPFFLAIALTDGLARGDETSFSVSMDERESLFFEEIPMVVTGFKKAQKITESPSAIHVITEEEIRQSGAIKLEDLFRFVPGMDVKTLNMQTSEVSARGFNSALSNKMLVLMDGRLVYLPTFGGVSWNSLPLFLENIKQIEVMRGPGSTLYGANAFNGVINIITRDPGERAGNYVSTTYGTNGIRTGTYLREGAKGRIAYRVSAGYTEESGYRKDTLDDFRESPRSTVRIDYDLSDTSNLQFHGGVLDIDQGQFAQTVDTLFEETHISGISDFAMLKYEKHLSESSEISLQLFRNELDIEIGEFDVDTDTVDFEAQFSLEKNRYMLVGGGNIRRNYAKTEIFNDGRGVHEHEGGLFVQNEYRHTDNLNFVAGIKMEYNERVQTKFSPRLTILYSPARGDSLRASVGKAYRNPSFYESFTELSLNLYPPPLSGIAVRGLGNDDLKPESMVAFELGYRTAIGKKTDLNIELYLNEIEDLVQFVVTDSITQGGQTLPTAFQPLNMADARAMGVEIGLSHSFFPWCKAFFNYTFQDIENTNTNTQIRSAPKNKVSGGTTFYFENGLSLDCRASYVGDTVTESLITGVTPSVRIDDYLRLDVRVAKTFLKNTLELAIVGQNLLEGNHFEYWESEVDRMILGTISLKFQ